MYNDDDIKNTLFTSELLCYNNNNLIYLMK